MALVHYRLDPANPQSLSSKAAARIDAMTTDDAQRNAVTDPDNPPMTNEELARGVFARDVRALRSTLGMTQTAFAESFRIDPSTLVDWEEGRFQPDAIARSYLKLIQASPTFVAKTVHADAAE